MKEQKKCPPLSSTQKQEVINYMQGHVNFARNKIDRLGKNRKDKSHEMWRTLKRNVNSLADPKFKASELPRVTQS